MSAHPPMRLLAHRWHYVPAVSFPIGGAVIKMVGGSTCEAVAVGAAPYLMYALLYVVFVIVHLAAVIRYLRSGADGQEAMARLIRLSTDAVVSILTLTPRASTGSTGPRRRTTSPRRRR